MQFAYENTTLSSSVTLDMCLQTWSYYYQHKCYNTIHFDNLFFLKLEHLINIDNETFQQNTNNLLRISFYHSQETPNFVCDHYF